MTAGEEDRLFDAIVVDTDEKHKFPNMKKLVPCVCFELVGEAKDEIDGAQWMNIYDYSQYRGQYLADQEEEMEIARARDGSANPATGSENEHEEGAEGHVQLGSPSPIRQPVPASSPSPSQSSPSSGEAEFEGCRGLVRRYFGPPAKLREVLRRVNGKQKMVAIWQYKCLLPECNGACRSQEGSGTSHNSHPAFMICRLTHI